MAFVISVAVALLIGFLYWLRKLVLKKRLSRGLGREVSDGELMTSISFWMKASTADERIFRQRAGELTIESTASTPSRYNAHRFRSK